MIAHTAPISGVACHQDKWIATAGYDNQVILWDPSTRRAVSRAFHDHLANQCAFDKRGQYLVTASSDYSARLWSVPDLRLRAVLDDHDDDVEMAVFHPSQPLIATASRDHRVRVFTFTGELVAAFEGHTADVISVEWSELGDFLISSSDDGTIRRWSLAEKSALDEIDMHGVETDTIALDAQGTVYAGNDNGEIFVISGGERASIRAHDAGVKRLVLSDDGDRLISLSYDRTARVWATGGDHLRLVTQTEMPADVWPRSCAFRSDGSVVFATFGTTYRTFFTDSGMWEQVEIPPTWGANAVAALDGGRDERAIVVGDAGVVWRTSPREDPEVVAEVGSLCNFLLPVDDAVFTGGQMGIVADASTGKPIYQHRSPLNCATGFRRAGAQHVMVGTYTGEGLVFRHTGRETGDRSWELVDIVSLFANAVKGLASSPRHVFAVCADRSATWVDIDQLAPVRRLSSAHEKIANGCTWLGGDNFASVGRDLTLRLWLEDGTSRVIRTPHTHSIKCVAANAPDADVIATGSYDGSVGLYRLRTDAWSDLRPTTSGISSITYSAGTGEFLASSYDGRVYRVGADFGDLREPLPRPGAAHRERLLLPS